MKFGQIHQKFQRYLKVKILTDDTWQLTKTGHNRSILCEIKTYFKQKLHWPMADNHSMFYNIIPRDLATARNGILSICVLRRIGPLWSFLGLFHTTRCTPDLATTCPPLNWILWSSAGSSGLWSFVKKSKSYKFRESHDCKSLSW